MKKASKAQLKQVRQLMRDKKARDEQKLFVAEGEKIIRDLIAKKYVTDCIVASADFVKRKGQSAFEHGIYGQTARAFETDAAAFERVSALRHSQGILAVFEKKEFCLESIPERKKSFFVLCDGVQDPGNLGAMIRTIAAFGADALLLAGESVDIYGPKVVRASSGAMADLPVFNVDGTTLRGLIHKGYSLWVARTMGEKTRNIADIKKTPQKLIMAFGNEGQGVSGGIAKLAEVSVHIPLAGAVESLNVAAACAIILYKLSLVGGV